MPALEFTPAFKRVMSRKSSSMQAAIMECISRLADNPTHPGLRVHKMQGVKNVWEAYVDAANRITFERKGDVILFRMNCNHDMLYRNP